MKRKLKTHFLLPVLALVFLGTGVALFFPRVPHLLAFSVLPLVVLAFLALDHAPAAFLATGLSTLFGGFCFSRLSQPEDAIMAILLIVLWGSVTMVHIHHQKIKAKHQSSIVERDDILKELRVVKQDMAFYEERKNELSKRAAQRRTLTKVARELGASLDPEQIQLKLKETAESLFPQHYVQVSYGRMQDAIDSFVVQKRQPAVAPSPAFPGAPMMAVPILAQGDVAGVLRVGNESGTLYSKDDLRLIDMLAGFCSSALDNAVLFDQLQGMALRDGLTGLLTHRAFLERLESAILEASRYQHPLSLILCDLDHFKSINDTYGHQSGDAVLQGFAHVLDRNIRDIDVAARIGGEEFVVMLFQAPHAGAVQNAERIRRDLENQTFEAGRQFLSVTGSFGVATFPDDATSPQQLMRQADQRMYQAKQMGRNKVVGKNP